MHGRPRMKRRVVQTWLEKTSAATTAAKKPTYGGSRKLRHRFEYSPESKSAFVELVPSFYPAKEEGPQKFKVMLEEVAGVERVEWQTSKTSQGNVGDHYCEHNLLVFSKMVGRSFACQPIEFELTRHQHTKDPEFTPTLTAMFKDPPDGMIGEAWRILLAVTDGKQLLPAHVQDYCRKHVARWEGKDSNAPVSDRHRSISGTEAASLPGTAPVEQVKEASTRRWTQSRHG